MTSGKCWYTISCKSVVTYCKPEIGDSIGANLVTLREAKQMVDAGFNITEGDWLTMSAQLEEKYDHY
jgi:hypothetical protein